MFYLLSFFLLSFFYQRFKLIYLTPMITQSSYGDEFGSTGIEICETGVRIPSVTTQKSACTSACARQCVCVRVRERSE